MQAQMHKRTHGMATLNERLKKVRHGSGSALGRTVRTVIMTILDGLLLGVCGGADDSDTAAADKCCASASDDDISPVLDEAGMSPDVRL